MKFELTKEEVARMNAWLDTLPKWDMSRHDQDFPLLGEIMTYHFTPTGLGVIATVTYSAPDGKKYELNLTDYNSW